MLLYNVFFIARIKLFCDQLAHFHRIGIVLTQPLLDFDHVKIGVIEQDFSKLLSGNCRCSLGVALEVQQLLSRTNAWTF